jgi:hypothetical protein
VLGATDRRLKAVVAQVPTISGFEQGLRRVAPDGIAALESVNVWMQKMDIDRGGVRQGSDSVTNDAEQKVKREPPQIRPPDITLPD